MRIRQDGWKYAASMIMGALLCVLLGGAFIHTNILSSALAAEDTKTANSVAPTTTQPLTKVAPLPTSTETAPEETIPLGAVDLRTLAEMEKQVVLAEEAFDNALINADNYADFYFDSAQTMQGIFSSVGLYVELPDYAQAQTATLRVSYTASDLILSDYSSLTFYMNGTPFYSCHVYAHNDNAPAVLYIDVPVSLMQDGYNLLEISAYVRLTNEEGCADDFNGANWIKIADTTCLRIGYDLIEDAGQINYYPYPFISLMDKTGANCAITVSDAAENTELEAALTVMADMGELVATQNEITFARIGDAQSKNIIYFGLAKNTPAELIALLNQQVPPTGALIQRAKQGTHEYLLVVAQEEAALLEAARFLSDDSRVAQTHAEETYISVDESQQIIDTSGESSLALEGQYTLKDIVGHGMSFSGPFHQEIVLYLPVAEDYVLSSESRFSLNIRYSENLDFDRSMMSVYWGSDIPLISKKLTKEGATGETITFAVPADAVNAAATSMVIAFELEVKDLDCTPRQLNMPWAYVAENSTFYLPQGENNTLSLANRPAPFQRGSRMNDVLVVLPDQPTADEYLLCGRTLSMIGGSDPYGTLSVCRASEFDALDADYNLIIIGEAANNALIPQINDALYFQYNDAMDAVLSNDKIILSPDYAKQIGTLQLIPSPYAQNRAAMILTAPQNEGLQALTYRISDEKMRWSLDKEAVIVDNLGKATAYQFTTAVESANGNEKPAFAQMIVENKEPMLFLAVGMGCMVLILLGAILVLLRVRSHKKDNA